MVDQFILYDQALATWLNTNIGTLVPGFTPSILMATPKRAFADILTGKVVSNKTMTLPRIAITRLGDVNDPKRFNSNRLRKLGWKRTDVWSGLRRAQFPAPVNIAYQVDLWTKYVKEMNIWEQKLHLLLSQSFMYLQIKPDDVYGYKRYPVFLESGVTDVSELEPSDGDRAVRKTFNLRAEAWVFDQDFTSKKTVKRVTLQFRDYDADALYDTMYLPPLETMATGDGVTTVFSFTLPRPPVLQNTVVIETTVSGATVLFIDNLSGQLVKDNTFVAAGTINYTTGLVNITFPTAPDLNTPIIATYFTDLS